MNCATVIEKLRAFADGERPADAEIAVHLASCAACRDALEAIRIEDAEIEAAFAPLRERRASLEERVVAVARAAGRTPRRRLAPILAAAAAGFVFGFGAALFGPWGPWSGAGPEAARLGLSTGAVEARPPGSGSFARLEAGESIAPGSLVRTIGAAKCSILAADGSDVRLDGGTEIRVDSARAYALERGRIFAVVAKSAASERFAVTTPEGRIEAVGTALDIHRVETTPEAPAHVRLTVLEGTARVGAESIEAGTEALVAGGSVTRREAASNLVRATLWVNEILALRGPDDAEFTARVDAMLAEIGRTKMRFLAEAEIRSLGDHCALPLLRHVQSPASRADVFRRRNAARILADVAPPALATDLVLLLEDGDGEVRAAAARGLARWTGETLGRDDAFWMGDDFAAGAAEWRRLLAEPGSPFAPRTSR